MEAFKTVIWLINIFSALSVIFLVLMQQGKGADAGAAFGTGSAQGVFGSAGSANFLSRSTAVAAVLFFVTCLILAYLAGSTRQSGGLDFSTVSPPVQSAPAETAPAETAPVIPE